MTLTMPRPGELAWQARAACLEADPEIFFPVGRGSSTKAAREICARCEVREQCLAYGLREQFGVWGGTSDRERRKLRKGLPNPAPQPQPESLSRYARPTLTRPNRIFLPVEPLQTALKALAPEYGGLRAMQLVAHTNDPTIGEGTVRTFAVSQIRKTVTLAWATKVCEALGRPDLPSQLWPEATEAAA